MDFTAQYVPSEDNVLPDPLSRLYEFGAPGTVLAPSEYVVHDHQGRTHLIPRMHLLLISCFPRSWLARRLWLLRLVEVHVLRISQLRHLWSQHVASLSLIVSKIRPLRTRFPVRECCVIAKTAWCPPEVVPPRVDSPSHPQISLGRLIDDRKWNPYLRRLVAQRRALSLPSI